jgi:hypothetical protein
MAKDYNFANQNPNMLFDLRQTYAMQILTPILILLEQYRDTNDFHKRGLKK